MASLTRSIRPEQRLTPTAGPPTRLDAGMLLTFAIGLAILGSLALRVQEEHALVPARVVDAAGKEICTGDEIVRGEEAFLTYGLMQFGSVYGHGPYFGLLLPPTTSTARRN